METYYDKLSKNSYRFEEPNGHAQLRLYVNDTRTNAFISIDIDKGEDFYARLNMRQEDRFSVRHLFRKYEEALKTDGKTCK